MAIISQKTRLHLNNYEILTSRVYSIKAYLWFSSDTAFNTVDKLKRSDLLARFRQIIWDVNKLDSLNFTDIFLFYVFNTKFAVSVSTIATNVCHSRHFTISHLSSWEARISPSVPNFNNIWNKLSQRSVIPFKYTPSRFLHSIKWKRNGEVAFVRPQVSPPTPHAHFTLGPTINVAVGL